MRLDQLDSVEIKRVLQPEVGLVLAERFKSQLHHQRHWEIYFYDTPQMELYNRGVILRSRAVTLQVRKGALWLPRGGDRASDVTVKLRPIKPSVLDPYWRSCHGFKVELDWGHNNRVVSASYTTAQCRKNIRQVNRSEAPVMSLFSINQLNYLSQYTVALPALDTVRSFGPIYARCWKTKDPAFPYRITVEQWCRPDGKILLEVSIKAPPTEMLTAWENFNDYLDLFCPDAMRGQETKTQFALQYFLT